MTRKTLIVRSAWVVVALLVLGAVFQCIYGSQWIADVGHFLDGSDPDPFVYVSRTKTDMRSLATALEAYYIDNGSYPARHPLRDFVQDPALLKRMGGYDLFSAEPGHGPELCGVTTPLAYITRLPLDEFSALAKPRLYYRGRWFTESRDVGAVPFAYTTVRKGYILFSPGPDGDYDIVSGDYDTEPLEVFDDRYPHPSPRLLSISYDASNGSASNGDIWRGHD